MPARAYLAELLNGYEKRSHLRKKRMLFRRWLFFNGAFCAGRDAGQSVPKQRSAVGLI